MEKGREGVTEGGWMETQDGRGDRVEAGVGGRGKAGDIRCNWDRRVDVRVNSFSPEFSSQSYVMLTCINLAPLKFSLALNSVMIKHKMTAKGI